MPAPRLTIRLALAAALGLTVVFVSPAATAGARKPKTHTVTIDGSSFQPAVIRIAPGDRVVWVNRDMFPHTATSRAGGFDSKVIPAGKSWTTSPAVRGTFPYVCVFHPTMKGTVEVR